MAARARKTKDSTRIIRRRRAANTAQSDLTPHVEIRKAYKMYIGGAFVRSESGRVWHDPHGIPLASRKDARDAVAAARTARDAWATRTAASRGQILYRLGEMLHARQSELVDTLRSGGLSAQPARREVAATIDRVVTYAGWTDKYQSLLASQNPVAGPHFTFTIAEPTGIVAIAAARRPALLGLAGAILPVIASGNTCIVLASETDPRVALTFSEALATSDLPGGVVNILSGRLSELLPQLAKHMEVAALDLHGVDAALAKSVGQLAAINVKRVHTRALDERAWFDAAAESLRWIERFVELKTVWHPCGV